MASGVSFNAMVVRCSTFRVAETGRSHGKMTVDEIVRQILLFAGRSDAALLKHDENVTDLARERNVLLDQNDSSGPARG